MNASGVAAVFVACKLPRQLVFAMEVHVAMSPKKIVIAKGAHDWNFEQSALAVSVHACSAVTLLPESPGVPPSGLTPPAPPVPALPPEPPAPPVFPSSEPPQDQAPN